MGNEELSRLYTEALKEVALGPLEEQKKAGMAELSR